MAYAHAADPPAVCGSPLDSADSTVGYRLDELEADAGPSDYALQVERDTLAINETKKLSP